MTDAPTTAPASARRGLLQFTFPGCRTELRLGALLVLAGTFLWNFAGPTLAIRIAVLGLPLLAVGAVLQALQANRAAGSYPWKLAVAMLVLGLPMCWDFRFRDAPGEPMQLLLVGPILAASGAWLALWWAVAALRARTPTAEAA